MKISRLISSIIIISLFLLLIIPASVSSQTLNLRPYSITRTATSPGLFDIDVEIEEAFADSTPSYSVEVQLLRNGFLVENKVIQTTPMLQYMPHCTQCLPDDCFQETCPCPAGETCARVMRGDFTEFCACVRQLKQKVKFASVPLSSGDSLTAIIDPSNTLLEFNEIDNSLSLIVVLIPALSTWGLLALVTLILIAGVFWLMRRRKVVPV